MRPVPPPIPYELRVGAATQHWEPSEEIPQAVEKALTHLETVLRSATKEPRGPAGPEQNAWQQLLRWVGKGLKWVWPKLPLTADLVPEALQTPIEWTAVSTLANQADRTVAKLLLARTPSRLEVITPLPLDVYRQGFRGADDAQAFDECLSKASTIRELPTDLDDLGGDGRQPPRRNAYLDAARKIVDECEVLIAIWNGLPGSDNDSSEAVIRYAVQAGRTVIWINPESPNEPLRTLHASPAGKRPRSIARRQPIEEPVLGNLVARPIATRAKYLSPGFHQLSSYNRDAAWDPERSAEIDQEARRGWIVQAAEARLPDRWLRNVAETFLPHYARADQLAARYQQLYIFAATWLFYLAAAAVTVAVVQNLFFPHVLQLVWLEIGCMVATLFLLGLSQQGAYHVKWLNDRMLAEHIRLAFFSALAGVRDTASEARRNSHLPFYRSADAWTVDVIDRLVASCPRSLAAEAEQQVHLPSLKRFLLEAWILEQAQWHAKNAHRKLHATHRAHRLGLCLFVTTLLLALAHLSGFGHEHGDSPHEHGDSQGAGALHYVALAISALAIALPAWGAAVHAINTLLERERIAERSSQMSSVLFEIAGRIERTTALAELQQEVRHARDMLLAENQEWLASLRFRPPVLPG